MYKLVGGCTYTTHGIHKVPEDGQGGFHTGHTMAICHDSTVEIGNDIFTTGRYGRMTFTITDVYDTVSSVDQS